MVPPKSSILIGFSIINHPFGVPLFLETPIYCQTMRRMLDHHISTSWDQRLIIHLKANAWRKNHLSGQLAIKNYCKTWQHGTCKYTSVPGWNGYTAGYILYLRGHLHRLPMGPVSSIRTESAIRFGSQKSSFQSLWVDRKNPPWWHPIENTACSSWGFSRIVWKAKYHPFTLLHMLKYWGRVLSSCKSKRGF